MYQTCPKCGHQRQPDDPTLKQQCPACGLVFRKWLKNLARDQELDHLPVAAGVGSNWQETLQGILLQPRAGIGKAELAGYCLIWLLVLVWGFQFIGMDFRTGVIMQSWLHNVDLVFHEAGHVLFSPFGRTLMILGGSLFQVLVPLILFIAFLIYNRDAFAASICLWWVGQNLMDVAPYIADARALRLPLLGGGTGADRPGSHDWANLLRPRGWLSYDIQIANWTDIIGSGILLIALLWGAAMLYIYYRNTMN